MSCMSHWQRAASVTASRAGVVFLLTPLLRARGRARCCSSLIGGDVGGSAGVQLLMHERESRLPILMRPQRVHCPGPARWQGSCEAIIGKAPMPPDIMPSARRPKPGARSPASGRACTLTTRKRTGAPEDDREPRTVQTMWVMVVRMLCGRIACHVKTSRFQGCGRK